VSDLTCNGAAVLSAVIRVPRVGAWVADLVVDVAEAPRGAVTLASADGALSVRGTVVRGGPTLETSALCVVGGAGRLAAEVPPLYYRGVPTRLPLGDLLREAGETLSATAQAAVLDRLLDRWVRERAPASTALGLLLDAVGGLWRVLFDGTVWVGEESWPVVELEHDLVSEDPAGDRVTIATDALPAALRPGTTFRDRRVSYVEHGFNATDAQTTVWFERASATLDRLAEGLEAFVRRTMRGVLHHARFPSRVVEQNPGDFTLALRPDNPALPGLVGVPLRTFVPGAVVKLAFPLEGPAPRVLLGFEGGDPRRPFADLWEAGTLGELAIPVATRLHLGDPAPSRGVARLNDTVEATEDWALWFAAVATAAGAAPPPETPLGAISSASAKVRSA
jgi:hypothetical protein